MEPPDGNVPARVDHQRDPKASTSQIPEGIPTKLSYANTINSTPNPTKQERESVIARRTTHNGMPTVFFKTKDYYGVMAAECRRMNVGRFLKIRPQIEKIRSRFLERFPLKGSVNIGVYDNNNVFLGFTNDEDYSTVWYRRSVDIEGNQMWLQKWSPDFKPEEDMPIVLVWVNLPRLPFHLHTWHYVKQIVSDAGTPLEIDIATRGKNRPSMAKVRLEVDLLKPLLTSVWVGDEDDNSPLKGFEQKLEYDNVQKYCKHCKKLGHSMMNCRSLERRRANEVKEVEAKDSETIAAGKNLERDKIVVEMSKGEPNANDKQQQGLQVRQKEVSNKDKIDYDKDNEKEEAKASVNTRTKQKKGKKARKIRRKRSKVIFKTTKKRTERREIPKQIPIQSVNEITDEINENWESSKVGEQEVKQQGTNSPRENDNKDDNSCHTPQSRRPQNTELEDEQVAKQNDNTQRVEEIELGTSSFDTAIRYQQGIHLVVELNEGYNMPQERDKEELGNVGDSEIVKEQAKEVLNDSDHKMTGSSNKEDCLPTRKRKKSADEGRQKQKEQRDNSP
ncbi:PREDICTED: uncharacterized protein LOC109241976 [Nicotiana attenuata]|uniref:DUF4283 domain-containing protein n=1 Tax=Nicotiana attenuata TaxID=49451 RepID=A0A314L4M6_NICAT|nr:PREDICTED: uncharacterized protein LOC109241976 [Nicotiana attenuata]OIT36492.1 hypothetical protein A4A49_03175 [Nicotiana attenuata]